MWSPWKDLVFKTPAPSPSSRNNSAAYSAPFQWNLSEGLHVAHCAHGAIPLCPIFESLEYVNIIVFQLVIKEMQSRRSWDIVTPSVSIRHRDGPHAPKIRISPLPRLWIIKSRPFWAPSPSTISAATLLARSRLYLCKSAPTDSWFWERGSHLHKSPTLPIVTNGWNHLHPAKCTESFAQ